MTRRKCKLPPKWQEYLLSLPKTGMGYHIVTIRRTNGTELVGVVVLNSERVLVDSDVPWDPNEIESIKLEVK